MKYILMLNIALVLVWVVLSIMFLIGGITMRVVLLTGLTMFAVVNFIVLPLACLMAWIEEKLFE